MDGSRFDDLTRTLAIGASRRHALKLFVGAVAAGFSAATGDAAGSAADDADDADRAGNADAARRRPFWNRDGPCSSHQDCGRLVPCTNGICTAVRCEIDGVPQPFGRNPANSCEYCVPSRDPNVPDAWQPFPVGFNCPDEFEATACLTTVGTCNADAECVPTPEPNNTLCGVGRTCCGGDCCTETQCCTAAGVCEECGPHCVIETVTYAALDGHPDGLCLFCDPISDFSFWTGAPDTFPCGPNLDQACCGGDCLPPGEECCGTGAGNREDGTCEPSEPGCTIDTVAYAAGAPNPANDCQVCDPDADSTGWTTRENNEICGSNGDRVCCDGSCCTGRGCCSPFGDGECSIEYCGFTDPCDGLDPCGCTIGGAFYANGEPDPGNVCQYCEIATSTTAWTPVSIAMCGPNQNQFCSGGVCCDLGICPDLATNTCGDYCSDVCAIGGTLYYNGDRSPANACEQCASHTDHTAWTLVAPNYYCDPDAQTGACCNGTCCNGGEFCNTNEGFVCDANSGS